MLLKLQYHFEFVRCRLWPDPRLQEVFGKRGNERHFFWIWWATQLKLKAHPTSCFSCKCYQVLEYLFTLWIRINASLCLKLAGLPLDKSVLLDSLHLENLLWWGWYHLRCKQTSRPSLVCRRFRIFSSTTRWLQIWIRIHWFKNIVAKSRQPSWHQFRTCALPCRLSCACTIVIWTVHVTVANLWLCFAWPDLLTDFDFTLILPQTCLVDVGDTSCEVGFERESAIHPQGLVFVHSC